MHMASFPFLQPSSVSPAVIAGLLLAELFLTAMIMLAGTVVLRPGDYSPTTTSLSAIATTSP